MSNSIREAGHDYVHDQDEPGHLVAKSIAIAVWCAVVALILFACGCQIPPGTHAQTAGIGLDVEPFGSAPNAPRARIGSFATQYSTPVPADSGASLNRTQLDGPLGVSQTSTQAIGAVGDQVGRGGETLVGVVGALHPPTDRARLIPFELPKRPAAPAPP